MAQQRIALRLLRTAAKAGPYAPTHSLDVATYVKLNGDRRGTGIRCARGMLWVTQPGDPTDHILRAGDQMKVTRRGPILIQAMTNSAVQLTPADHRL